MLYSFLLKTDPLPQNAYVLVVDGDCTYRFVAREGHKQHYYTNILVDGPPRILFGPQHDFHQLAAGGKVYLTPAQAKLNASLAKDRNVTYRVSTRGTPRRAIVTFPHYKGVGGWQAPYAILDGRKLDLDDTLYISFQEPYLTMGSYYLSDNSGGDPVPTAVSVIRRILEKYGLDDNHVTFLGSSKGANIAAMVSQHFEDNQLILCSYSNDIEYRVRNTDYSHLAMTLDRLDIGFPDSLEILRNESNRKETHWFFAIGDHLAIQGQEDLTASNLRVYPSTESHSRVITGKWNSIRELISRRYA